MALTFFIRRQGSILILSIWALSFLGLMAFFAGARTQQRILAARRLEQRILVRNMAQSAALYAIELVVSEEDGGFFGNCWVSRPELFERVEFKRGSASVQHEFYCREKEGKRISYGLTDEERKLNLNYASGRIIKNLLMVSGGLEENSASSLAEEVLFWRGSDNLDSGQAAALEAYYREKYGYSPKRSKFDMLEEFLLLSSVDSELFFSLKPHLTVFTSGEAVNINTAGREVMLSLGLSPALIEKIIAYRNRPGGQVGKKNVFQSPDSIVGDLKAYTDLTASEENELSEIIEEGLLICFSNTFTTDSISAIDNSSLYGKITFVFDSDGKIRYWNSNL